MKITDLFRRKPAPPPAESSTPARYVDEVYLSEGWAAHAARGDFRFAPDAVVTMPPGGVPLKAGGEIVGRVFSATPGPEGLELSGQVSAGMAELLRLHPVMPIPADALDDDPLRQEAIDRADRIIAATLPVLPWQRARLIGLIHADLRRSPRAPESFEPADVEAWRVASGLPARIRPSSTTDGCAGQLEALRADLGRLARETRWGTSAGRLAFAAFTAAGGPTGTPWQAFEAALRFVAKYEPGGLEDDRPAGV